MHQINRKEIPTSRNLFMSVAIRAARPVVPFMPPVYQFSVEQYHRMIETGVLTEDDSVELLEGWIVPKMPHNPRHDGTISRVDRRLRRVVSEDWVIRIQSAITTDESEPEPDIAVVEGPEEAYFDRHPGPQDIELLIEVSDTTLVEDQMFKGPLYARAQIRIYWIVNLIDRQVEVHTNPKAGKNPSYRRRRVYGVDDSVPLVLHGKIVCSIPVRELLPS
jgi:hypothetical protein